MKFFVTGGAGFIGSHFCDRVLNEGHEVMAFDNLSTGRMEFLSEAKKSSAFQFHKGDIRELEQLTLALNEYRPDWVVHFAANADVRFGLERPRRDIDYNTIGTWNVTEAARNSGTKNILFSSTGSVYGEPNIFPTPEDAPFPVQTSLYAASKLAGEGILSAYCYGYGLNAVVFRFVSIMGPRYSHGHVFDFIRSLRADPKKLRVLGNGLQNKSYLHISDLMNGLWCLIDSNPQGFHILNIGHDDSLTVKQSIGYILERLKLAPSLDYTGGERGWIGDSPRIQLATKKLKGYGWEAKKSLKESVWDTVDFLVGHPELFEESV